MTENLKQRCERLCFSNVVSYRCAECNEDIVPGARKTTCAHEQWLPVWSDGSVGTALPPEDATDQQCLAWLIDNHPEERS
jgi:hypothetical protein